jgi:hypothetical protein
VLPSARLDCRTTGTIDGIVNEAAEARPAALPPQVARRCRCHGGEQLPQRGAMLGYGRPLSEQEESWTRFK